MIHARLGASQEPLEQGASGREEVSWLLAALSLILGTHYGW